jgi:regulatory factor X
VRRDRVFSRYTERCGNERVPTLNPASFGKLVRIIFPNVQTRRLGVRGESKYHYVDLSLFPEDEDRQHQQYQQYQITTMGTGDAMHDMHNPVQIPAGVQRIHARSTSMSQPILPQPPTDSADFPLPSKTYAPRPIDYDEDTQIAGEPTVTSTKPSVKMDCHYLNTPTVRVRTSNMQIPLVSALPAVRSNLPGTVSSYLGLPSSTTHTTFSPPNSQTDSPIDLPDIHAYLANTTYDRDIATSLSHLYRSYCIIVIDSFRYCREKPFFHHHSAFNGTMTVPISKMLANERLAPWIQECDMRMYKKMIRYIAPLVTQVVPEQVWNMFDHVSKRLVPHLVSAFEEKCPTHVLVAKIVPAARFCHLLKKLKTANTAANHAATMLVDERGRTQMWVDLLACVDPEKVLEDSVPPPECWSAVEGIISGDLKALIAPGDEDFARAAEQDLSSIFAGFMTAAGGGGGLMGPTTENEEMALSPLDGWIQWLEKLPLAFPKHHPQCLINWHNGFWKSIMTQLGIGGASTYQAWWYLEAFLNNMLGWLTQMEGLLMDETQQKDLEEREVSKKRQDEYLEITERSLQMDGSDGGDRKRKRYGEDVGGEERSASRASHTSESSNGRETESRPQTAMTSNTGLDGAADDHELDELSNEAPLDLPSIDTSPQKRQHQAHDDSGISLDVDIEGEVNGGDDQLKRLKKEWGIMSDPADADGHVVVV